MNELPAGVKVCAFLLFGSSSILILLIAWYRIMDWWDSVWGGTGYSTTGIYNTGNTGKKTTMSLDKKAKPIKDTPVTPPSAEFFGRIQGEQVQAYGKLEEKYLNILDYNAWLSTKRRWAALTADNLNEKANISLKDEVFEAKTDK